MSTTNSNRIQPIFLYKEHVCPRCQTQLDHDFCQSCKGIVKFVNPPQKTHDDNFICPICIEGHQEKFLKAFSDYQNGQSDPDFEDLFLGVYDRKDGKYSKLVHPIRMNQYRAGCGYTVRQLPNGQCFELTFNPKKVEN